MADYGLLGGIGQGLQAGVQAYQQAKQMRNQQELSRGLMQQGALEKGLIPVAGTEGQDIPSYQLNAGSVAKQDFDAAQYQSSPEFASHVKGLLNAKPSLAKFASSVPGSMSPAQWKGDPLSEVVKGEYGFEGRQITALRVADRNDIAREQLEERKNVNATHIGTAYDKNPIILQTKKTNQSLDRAESLLYGKEPITSKSFNILQQDFINAMAPGGAATEGKVNREMVETAQAQFNELQQKFGQVRDLRKEQPQVVENLKNLIKQVKGDYKEALSNEAMNVHETYLNASSPQSVETNKRKLKTYAPEEYAKRYGAPGLLQESASPAGTPKVGEVQDGHVFLGGNPADPKSWKAQ